MRQLTTLLALALLVGPTPASAQTIAVRPPDVIKPPAAPPGPVPIPYPPRTETTPEPLRTRKPEPGSILLFPTFSDVNREQPVAPLPTRPPKPDSILVMPSFRVANQVWPKRDIDGKAWM